MQEPCSCGICIYMWWMYLIIILWYMLDIMLWNWKLFVQDYYPLYKWWLGCLRVRWYGASFIYLSHCSVWCFVCSLFVWWYGRISSRLQVLINLLCLWNFYLMFLGMMIDAGGDWAVNFLDCCSIFGLCWPHRGSFYPYTLTLRRTGDYECYLGWLLVINDLCVFRIDRGK